LAVKVGRFRPHGHAARVIGRFRPRRAALDGVREDYEHHERRREESGAALHAAAGRKQMKQMRADGDEADRSGLAYACKLTLLYVSLLGRTRIRTSDTRKLNPA